MGVCAVATPVHDAVGAVGALTVEVAGGQLAEKGARTPSRGPLLATGTAPTTPCSARRAAPPGRSPLTPRPAGSPSQASAPDALRHVDVCRPAS